MTNTTLLSIAIFALLLPGCGKKKVETAAADGAEDGFREKPASEIGLKRQPIDLDGDEDPEISNFYRERGEEERLLVKKEIDLNRDGKVDVISHFDEQGRLLQEEMDGDYDGVFDWTDYYKGGVRVKSEYDTDFDGGPNVWKYYSSADGGEPILKKMERDIDGDGTVDVTQEFNAAGEVIRTVRANEEDETEE